MNKETRKCPFCGEEILATAKKCKHCKKFIIDDTVSSNVSKQQSQNIFSNKNIVVAIIVVLAAISFIRISSNPLLAGCSVERNGGDLDGYLAAYSCDNKYYNKVTINSSYGDKYPNYNVYKDDELLGMMKRKNGEFACTITTRPDWINGCNISQFKKLVIESSNNMGLYKELNKAKHSMRPSIDEIVALRESFTQKNTSYENWSSPAKWVVPSNCKEVISAAVASELTTDYNVDSCQMKLKDKNIVAFSQDGQKATIYNNGDYSKYYVSIKMENRTDDSRGYCNMRYDFIDEVIPATEYIKDTSNLRQFTKAELDPYTPLFP